MDLSKSIENWVDHITRILSDNNTKQYTRASINGFKNASGTKAAYEFIKLHMSELTTDSNY